MKELSRDGDIDNTFNDVNDYLRINYNVTLKM